MLTLDLWFYVINAAAFEVPLTMVYASLPLELRDHDHKSLLSRDLNIARANAKFKKCKIRLYLGGGGAHL